MSETTPGQASAGQAPLQPVDSVYLYHWRFDRGEEFGLYRQKADADAAVAARTAEHPGEGLFEILGMAVLDRPQPQAALAAREPDAAPVYQLACGCTGSDGKAYTPEGVWHCGEHGPTTIIGGYIVLPPEPQPAPELAPRPGEALAADNAKLRDTLTRILSWFTEEAVVSSRRYASVTRTQLAGAYRDSGLTVPEEKGKQSA